MNFGDAPEEAQFRSKLKDWLAQAIPQLEGTEPTDIVDRLPYFRAWQQMLQQAGYAGISWPKEYGGRGASVIEQAIFAEECDRAGAPDRLNAIGDGFAGQTIIHFGTEDQKERFLPRILSGEDIWCQLFSEPGAGSDLAGLDARAERVEGGWRITGQKVWTSRAQISSMGILLARTGGPRHAGITYFLFPVEQEGVTIRPLRQMTGDSDFNEVFLENAFVPDDLVVGEVNDGWRIARATLQFERTLLATGRINMEHRFNALLDLVRESTDDDGRPVGADPVVRQKVADLYGRSMIHRLTAQRGMTRAVKGEPPGPESSVGKLFMSPLMHDLGEYAIELMGSDGQLYDGSPRLDGDADWQRFMLFMHGLSIAGGTPEIQKNIVAERVLGMPR